MANGILRAVPDVRPAGVAGELVSDAELLRRFAASRDEGAFAELVGRHGPLVRGVCRRILGDVHAADDAFQAVFLVLAQKSAGVRKPELLANWLYGVACRIARKARSRIVRTQARERLAGKMPTLEQVLEAEWGELITVLDEEMSRLPEKYRAPLVLCYLHGQTNMEAARQLGWPSGSISERLARAREMLRKRLTRRGLTLSAALLAVLLSEKGASAAIDPGLVSTTVDTAMAYVGSAQQVASVPASVWELARTSVDPARLGLLKTACLVLIIATAVVLTLPSLGFSAKSLWFASSGDWTPTAGACK